jgi:transposase InsO family protein
LPIIRRLVDQRPTYGYRRIAALLNRERRAAGKPVVNAKRVHRIMSNQAMLLEKHTAKWNNGQSFIPIAEPIIAGQPG